MKMRKGSALASVRFILTMVLLAILPQTSQQTIGKERCPDAAAKVCDQLRVHLNRKSLNRLTPLSGYMAAKYVPPRNFAPLLRLIFFF